MQIHRQEFTFPILVLLRFAAIVIGSAIIFFSVLIYFDEQLGWIDDSVLQCIYLLVVFGPGYLFRSQMSVPLTIIIDQSGLQLSQTLTKWGGFVQSEPMQLAWSQIQGWHLHEDAHSTSFMIFKTDGKYITLSPWGEGSFFEFLDQLNEVRLHGTFKSEQDASLIGKYLFQIASMKIVQYFLIPTACFLPILLTSLYGFTPDTLLAPSFFLFLSLCFWLYMRHIQKKLAAIQS